MAHLSQADFTRAARGAPILAGQGAGIEPIIGGISSIARCAVRDVHRESAAAAMSYFNRSTAKWLLIGGSAAAAVRTYHDSLAQYIAWENNGFTKEAQLVGLVACEAIEEPDTVVRHPQVVEVVAGLAGREGLNALFGSNGHDPDAFVTALAAGLQPYKELPLEDPGIVESMATLAVALRGEYNLDHPASA